VGRFCPRSLTFPTIAPPKYSESLWTHLGVTAEVPSQLGKGALRIGWCGLGSGEGCARMIMRYERWDALGRKRPAAGRPAKSPSVSPSDSTYYHFALSWSIYGVFFFLQFSHFYLKLCTCSCAAVKVTKYVGTRKCSCTAHQNLASPTLHRPSSASALCARIRITPRHLSFPFLNTA
jgi:hypothetical protein